ncbi:hypothetical protein [Streptomyces sp. HNM0574]|uniref:hypothetical protein n=1 Tax=Streptomyces sp. HNM0574 TaxID=2714954 RepID=UPI00146DE26D|nr:hypothetical protein [Streptomyces sp. HNM0574]NLU66709.1 hypothetical protein [Streptomyces sp. HNM0574]
MTSDETSNGLPQVRLRVELVVEIADPEALARAALDRIDSDALLPDDERGHAREIVGRDAGEAIAYLVDPVDLVSELPGVELSHATWGSEAAEVDPEWDDEDDEDDENAAGEEVYDVPVGERAW